MVNRTHVLKNPNPVGPPFSLVMEIVTPSLFHLPMITVILAVEMLLELLLP